MKAPIGNLLALAACVYFNTVDPSVIGMIAIILNSMALGAGIAIHIQKR